METIISKQANSTYTCADLFCCAGGVSTGIKTVGVDFKLVLNEYNKMLKIYKQIFLRTIIMTDDIFKTIYNLSKQTNPIINFKNVAK